MIFWHKFLSWLNPPKAKLTFVYRKDWTGYETKIVGWQIRELILMDDYSLHKGKEDIAQLKKINELVNLSVSYESDLIGYKKRDFWETAKQVQERKKADCDGYAIYKMWLMREANLPDDKIMGVICADKSTEGHMMAGYKYKENDFYCLDNGYMYKDVIRASELFGSNNCKGMKPVAWFNLFSSGSLNVR